MGTPDQDSETEHPAGGLVGGTPPPADLNVLFDAAYSELKGLASRALSRQRSDHTLQPTALVHEVWIKLSKGLDSTSGREHFLAVAARAMRQVLQDHARGTHRAKRAGKASNVQLIDAESLSSGKEGEGIDVVVLVDVLERLRKLNERHADITELRILGGLKMQEVADALGVSVRTVESDWTFARAWLRAELAVS